MRFSRLLPLAHILRRLISSPRPSKDKPNSYSCRQFAMPDFDADNECLFWQERHKENVNTLKLAFCIGAGVFLVFIILDFFQSGLSAAKIIVRFFAVVTFAGLSLYIKLDPQPYNQITVVASLSAYLALGSLLAVMILDGNPNFYMQTCVSTLPIYFFTYGQLYMPIKAALLFGLLAMINLPLAGYWIGVDILALIPSIMILLVVNFFGLCSRYQLEKHSRHSFLARRKAEALAENQTQFLRQLSHNLRQPLQALSCYSSILDASFNQNPVTELRHIVNKMGASVDELNNFFNHILNIANLKSGQQLPFLTTVDINLLLARLEDQFAPQATKRGLKLHVRLRSHPPFCVHSDPNILSQIIGNLIDNAIKYTNKGWILVKTVKVNNTHLRLHVIDTGIGIAEEQKQHIFKEFYRAHHCQREAQVRGFGIGLAYVLKALGHLPEHTLTVYSKLHHGSDFLLSLPVGMEVAHYASRSAKPDDQLAGCFVFVVDGDQDVLDALEKQLLAWGCRIQKAHSMSQIQAALVDNLRPPDLLITEFYLTDNETADDIIATIEADCGPVPTVVLTAHAIPTSYKSRWLNTTQFLHKPVSTTVLLEAMAKAMDIEISTVSQTQR